MLKSLETRYATQIFDSEKKIPVETLNTILECARLAPSAFGIQPLKYIIVENKEIREKLKEVGYNQPKIVDSSHLIVLAVPKKVDVDSFIKLVAETRECSVENLSGYSAMISSTLNSKTEEQAIEWFTRQAYLALGVLISAASMEGVDTAPMEGFVPKEFDRILGLDGWESKVIISLGYRSDKDAVPKKVRYSLEKLVQHI